MSLVPNFQIFFYLYGPLDFKDNVRLISKLSIQLISNR